MSADSLSPYQWTFSDEQVSVGPNYTSLVGLAQCLDRFLLFSSACCRSDGPFLFGSLGTVHWSNLPLAFPPTHQILRRAARA